MKTIIFNEVEYRLVYLVFEDNTKIRVTIYKDNYNIPYVVDEIKDTETITVLENDEVIAQYNDFSKLVAIQIYDNYPIDGERTDTVISIELVNADLQAQIDDLNDSVATQQNAIDDLTNSIEEITPYTETKTAYIGDESVTFNDVPEGNLSVFTKDSEGNEIEYSVTREDNRVVVTFSPLEYVTDVTISVQ